VSQPETELRRGRGPVISVCGAALAYAVLRYAVFGAVPPDRAVGFALFVANKAIASAALGLFALALGLARDPSTRRTAGRAGTALAGVHVAVAALVLVIGDLPKLRAPGGDLLARTWLALTLGASAALLLVAHRVRVHHPRGPALRHLIVALVGLHAAALGVPNWVDPARWPGRLPPITLLAALLAGAGLLAARRRRALRASPRLSA
jgi:hypothetical protein